nr:unnamed protein product [Callosobruchus chinensis]
MVRAVLVYQSIKKNPTSFWSFIESKTHKNWVPERINSGDKFFMGSQEVSNAFAAYFSSVFGHARSTKNNRKSYSRVLAIENNTLPDRLKEAVISHVYERSGDSNSVEVYRPISVLNSLAKIFGSILYNDKMQRYHKQFAIQQHGFLNSRSTVTNLCILTDAEAIHVTVSLMLIMVITFTHRKNVIVHIYTINNCTLPRKTECKDLAVAFQQDLRFHKHYETIVYQAYRALRFVVTL